LRYPPSKIDQSQAIIAIAKEIAKTDFARAEKFIELSDLAKEDKTRGLLELYKETHHLPTLIKALDIPQKDNPYSLSGALNLYAVSKFLLEENRLPSGVSYTQKLLDKFAHHAPTSIRESLEVYYIGLDLGISLFELSLKTQSSVMKSKALSMISTAKNGALELVSMYGFSHEFAYFKDLLIKLLEFEMKYRFPQKDLYDTAKIMLKISNENKEEPEIPAACALSAVARFDLDRAQKIFQAINWKNLSIKIVGLISIVKERGITDAHKEYQMLEKMVLSSLTPHDFLNLFELQYLVSPDECLNTLKLAKLRCAATDFASLGEILALEMKYFLPSAKETAQKLYTILNQRKDENCTSQGIASLILFELSQ